MNKPQNILVGRDRERHALLARCEQLQESKGGFYWLSGEAGIGKTSLMEEIKDWAQEKNYQTLWGRHIAHRQAPPLNGLRQAIAQLFGVGPADGPEEVDQKVRILLEKRWSGLQLHRPILVGFLDPLAESSAETTGGQHLYYILFRLLAAAAQENPYLLFMDDCHWADTLTLDCMSFLSSLLIDQPILVIGAYRPEEPDLI